MGSASKDIQYPFVIFKGVAPIMYRMELV
jgi:hypothetical protein